MIKFEISSQIVEIAPNNVAQVSLSVTNTSQIIDFFTISIEPLISPETMGLYPGWVEINQPTFSLRPAGDSGRGGDSTQTLTIKVNIPPQVYAGNYAGQILIVARSGADNSAEIPFNIVISQVDAQSLEIIPIDQSSRKSTEVYRVVVSNQGNAPHIYSLYAEDPNDDLKFTIDPPEVPLRPGEQAAITLKAQPRQRNWVGDEQNHDFKVKLEGSDQEIRGSFKQKAAIAPLHWFGRHWGRVVFFLALLLVLLIVAGIFFLPLLLKTTTSAFCGPVSLRSVNVLSNGTTTNILVSGRNGAQPMAVAVTEQADKLPGIYASLVSVSPDGRRIAYVTASNLAMDDARIWIKNLDTDQPPIASIPITRGLWPVAPVWSSNGEKLAYVVRHPTPIAAAAVTTTAAPAAAGGITTTAALSTTTAAPVAQTPGAAAANPSQLDLYLVAKIGEDAKKLASPPGLEPKLFYGNTVGTLPLCFASDDASLLVRPQNNDNKQTQVSLADGKATEVLTTPLPFNNALPKPNIPGLILPFNSLVGVPASLLQVPNYRLASIQQQTGTGTTTTPKPGTTTTPPKTAANSCPIARPFSQNDPRWADLPLTVGSTNRMADLGCPLTGAAILLNYQQVDTNPAELSSCLGNLTSPLNQAGWFAIGQQCGGFSLQGGVRADFSWDLLDSALQKGPALVGLLGGPSGSHFLVVTGGADNVSNSYTVADPWDGTTYKTLDYFLSKGYQPRWVISYEGPGAPCVTGTPDTTNQIGIRITGVADGGLYQTPQPFRYEIVGTNDPATASLRIVNPRANLDDNGKTILPNETQTFSTEGNYSIAIAVKNSSGDNVLTRNIYFTIDHTAPVLGYRLNPTPDKATNKSVVPVSVQLSATDDLSGIASIEYQINGSQWLPYTSDTAKVPLTLSDNGTYTINYRATDGTGNMAAAQTINFAIDKPVAVANGGSRPGGANGAATTAAAGANGAGGAAGAGGAKTPAVNPVVPTVTPVPTQTPRPPVKNTPTIAPTTPPPTTIAATPTLTGTSLLPTGSPAITPTTIVSTTAPVSTTVAATPTPTIELKAVLTVQSPTPLTFLPSAVKQQLQFQNTGNAPLIWTIPGSSNALVSFGATTGNLPAGETASVDITVLNPNLTGADQNFTFEIDSNGGNQTVGVTIQSQPLPSANLSLISLVGTSLNFTNTVKIDITIPNSNVTPNHVDLYATYKNCVSSCVAEPVKIGSFPVSGTSLNVAWITSNIVPQDGITLSGNLCLNQDCSILQPTNAINNLQIDMTATFTPPSLDHTLAPTTTIAITGQSERTKKVKISAVVDGTSTPLNDANEANGWTITWDTSLISPFSTVVIEGLACNTLDDSGVCLPIQSLTGYTTFMSGTVTTIPDLTTDPPPALSAPITFTIETSANVKSVSIDANYTNTAGQPQQVSNVGTSLNKPWVITVDPTTWPAQSNVSFNVKVCFTQDSNSNTCTVIKTFTGLSVPAGAPAHITDLTAEPKFTTFSAAFPNPLSVKITDAKQNPVAGAVVVFQLPVGPNIPTASFSGSASASSVVVNTDNSGIATVTTPLIANNIEGVYQVTVTVNGSSINAAISLSNVKPGALPIRIKSGNLQTARIGQAFPQKLQVQLDSPGISVTFTSQSTGTSAHFANNTSTYITTTDASGVATAIDLIANASPIENISNYPVVGTHSVRVSADSYSPVLFALTNIVGDPASITPIAPLSQSAVITHSFLNISVQVKDAGGNLLRNNTTSQSIQVLFQSPSTADQPGATFNNSTDVSMTVAAGNQDDQNPTATAIGISANLKAGSYHITATVQGFPAVTTSAFNFVNIPGEPFSVVISPPTSTTIQANGTFSATLQATVYDVGQNPVADIPTTTVRFNSPSFGAGAMTDPSSIKFSNGTNVFTTTVAGGQGMASVTTPIMGTCGLGDFPVTATVLDASSNPVAVSHGVTLTIRPGNPAKFTGVAQGTGQHTPILTAIANPLQTTLADSCGNPLSNQSVTFTAPSTTTAPSGIFSTTHAISATVNTDANGLATAPIFTANDKASVNSFDIIASSTNFPSSDTISFTLYNDPGAPFKIMPSGIGSDASSPLSITVGTTNSIASNVMTATVFDIAGNKVYSSTSAGPTYDKIKIVFEDTPAGGAGGSYDSSSNFVFPDANGVITSPVSLKANTKAGDYTVTARAFIDNNVTGTFYLRNLPDVPNKITPIPVTDDVARLNSVVTTSTNTAVAFTTTLQVKVTDQYNNVIPSTSVTFTVNPGTSLSNNPNNKPRANFSTPLSGPSFYTAQTDASGLITSPVFYAGRFAGDYDITAQSSPPVGTSSVATFYLRNLADTIPVAVDIVPSAPALTTTVQTAFQEFSAFVSDKNGNGIPGIPVTFTVSVMTGGSATGIWKGSAAQFITQTNSIGYAFVNKGVTQPNTLPTSPVPDLTANQKAGNYPVTASVATTIDPSGFITSSIDMNNVAENIVADANITFTGPTLTSQPVEQPFTTFKLHVEDQYQNPINNFPVTFSVPVSTTGMATGIFVSPSSNQKTVQTNLNGDAIVPDNAFQAGIKAGTYTMTASVPVTPTGTSTFTRTINLANLPGAPDGPHITAAIYNYSVMVGTSYTNPISVTVADKYNNIIPGATVTYTVGTTTDGATATALAPVTSTTDNSGQVNITSVTANNVAGGLLKISSDAYPITATAKTSLGQASATLPIRFTNLPAAAAKISIYQVGGVDGNNQTPDVGTVFTHTLQVRVVDANNNLVADGTQVVFTAPDATAGASATFSPGTSSTITASTSIGVATVAGGDITANNQLGAYSITTTVPGATLSQSATFNITNLANLEPVGATSGQTKQAGGEKFGPLQVKVVGAGNTGVPNQPVTFNVAGPEIGVFSSGGTCSGAATSITVNTDSNGIATINDSANVSSFCAGTSLGSYPITATTTVVGVSKSDILTATNSATLTYVDGSGQTKLVAGENFSPLKVKVTGFGTSPIPNAVVNFNVDPNHYIFINPADGQVLSDSNGAAQLTLKTGSLVGSYNITATLGGPNNSNPQNTLTQSFTLTNTVNISSLSAPSLLAGSSSPTVVGESGTITATVSGFGGVGVGGVNVVFASTDPTRGTIPALVSSGTSAANGNVNTTLIAANVIGNYDVTAKAKFDSGVVASTAIIPAITRANLTTVSAVSPLAGNPTVPISVTVTGNGGAKVPGVNIQFTSNDTTLGTLSGTNPVTTDVNGVATINVVTANKAGPYTIGAAFVVGQVNPSPVAVSIPITNMVIIASTSTPSLLAGSVSPAISGESQTINATVKGFNNTPINSGVTVEFTSNQLSRGTVSPATATPTGGVASTTLTAGTVIGNYTVTAAAKSGLTVVSTANATINAATTATLSTISAPIMLVNGESAPISVTVTGNAGAKVFGASIQFTSTDLTAGSIPSGNPATSGADGVATLNLISGGKIGSYTVGAGFASGQLTTPPTPVSIPVTNRVEINSTAAPSLLAASTSSSNNGESATIIARVSGYSNSPVGGVTVIFTSNDASKGNISGSNSATSASNNGQASVTLKAGNSIGAYIVSAQAQFNSVVVADTDATINAVTTANLVVQSGATPLAGGETKPVSVKVTGNGGVNVLGAQIQFTSDDTTMGTLSGTNPASTNSSGVATVDVVSTNTTGGYTVSAAFVSGQPMTVTIPITNIVSLVSSSTPTPLVGTSASGLDSVPVVVTAQGYNNIPISGITISLTPVVSVGANGIAVSPISSTDSLGQATGSVAANSTYGAWTLKAQTTIGTVVIPLNIQVVNTVQIASISKPHPVVNGGTDIITATVTGKNGYNPGSGIPVKFSVTSSSGCSGNCGTVPSTNFNTNTNGVATATITSKTGTTFISISAAQSYTVDAAVQVATGVTPNLASPVNVVNTLLINKDGSTASPLTTTGNLVVGVSDNNSRLNGFTVQFTIMSGSGITATLGTTTADGYMCINTCPSPITSADEYLGMEMTTAGSGGNAGEAGVNISQAISRVSLDGNTYTTAIGVTGVSLKATGAAGHQFTVRARVVNIPGMPAAEAPYYDFILTT